MRRIDLKANSRVFSALGESFSHAPLEGVQGANVSQRLQTANTAEEQGKKPILLERGRNQQHALPWCLMSVCCSFCGDGFSRPSYVFWCSGSIRPWGTLTWDQLVFAASHKVASRHWSPLLLPW